MATVDPSAAAAQAQAIADRLMMEGAGQFAGPPVDGADLSNKRKLDEQGPAFEGGEGPTRKRLSFSGPGDAEGGYGQSYLENNGGFSQPDAAGAGVDGQYSEVIECPKTLVGKLIGREGATIKDLQTRSKTKIQIDHDSQGETKKVTVFGTRDSVQHARALIKEVLENEPSAAQPGEATRTVECPAGIVGRIIGRQGETIRSLQTASGAHIVVDQNFPEGVPRKINISGRPDGVERAVKMITELINGEPSSAQAIIQKYGMGDAGHVKCPKAMVGRLIGKGGETIKQMQKTTGASIQIDQSMDPCPVTVTGKRSAVDQAVRMVNAIINNEEPFAQGAGGGPPGGFGGPGGPRPGFPGPGFPGGGFPGAGGPYGGPPAGGPYGGYGSFPMGQGGPPGPYPGGYGGYGMYGGGYPPSGPQQYPGYGGGYGGNSAPTSDPYNQGSYGGQYGQQSGGGASSGGQAAAGGASSSVWQEHYDGEGRPYYYNTQTGASQWEKPAEMQ